MNVKVLRCPSDDWNTPRVRAMPPPIGNDNASAKVYKYSYVLNHYIGAGFLFVEYQKSVALNQPAFVDTFSNAKGIEAVGKITQVRHPAEKVLLYEEAESTIDDGHASPDLINSTGQALNLLAIRHDRRRVNAEPTGAGFFCTTTDRLIAFFNGKHRGNVAFADGHAAYITRAEMHLPSCYLPKR
jgi:prepilin-type processing-associated H-X9-DG protein